MVAIFQACNRLVKQWLNTWTWPQNSNIGPNICSQITFLSSQRACAYNLCMSLRQSNVQNAADGMNVKRLLFIIVCSCAPKVQVLRCTVTDAFLKMLFLFLATKCMFIKTSGRNSILNVLRFYIWTSKT